MKRLALILLASSALAACETLPASLGPDITLDEPDYVEDLYLAPDVEETEVAEAKPTSDPVSYRAYTPTIIPVTVPGQLKPLPAETEAPSLKPYEAIETANGKAAVEPSLANYMNAIQVYPYTVGALYQIYCAPEQVTDIVLQPGEELVSVSAGDTVRWVLGDTVSGTGAEAQAHILIKPIQAGLRTNLIITTSLRAYHLELRAFEETYMAAVSWRYADQQLVTPHWRPAQVFDDGRKVYIRFPARLDQGEAPALFVIGRDGKSQLVNYRMAGDYYVVDRLFARAELRLGEKRQDVVKIVRNDLGSMKP